MLAAFFGVQKQQVLEEDAKVNNYTRFIIVGLLLTLGFVLLLRFIVHQVLS